MASERSCDMRAAYRKKAGQRLIDTGFPIVRGRRRHRAFELGT
jgi:hypothetical protein